MSAIRAIVELNKARLKGQLPIRLLSELPAVVSAMTCLTRGGSATSNGFIAAPRKGDVDTWRRWIAAGLKLGQMLIERQQRASTRSDGFMQKPHEAWHLDRRGDADIYRSNTQDGCTSMRSG